MRKAERAVLVGIVVAVGVALRWGFAASARIVNPLRADAGEYASYARNLVENGVYSLATDAPRPDSFRSPGYPGFLALCRLCGGDAHWQAVAIGLQVLFGGVLVWLTYKIARSRLSFGYSLAASALVALSPHLVTCCGLILTEALTTFLMAAGFALLTRAHRGRNGMRAAATGALFGLVGLCNEALLFAPVLVTLVAWRRLGRARTVAFAVCALLPCASWMVRNATTRLARTGGERVVASISHGSYPGMIYQDPRLRGFPYREDPAQPAFGSSWSELGRVLGDRVAAEPLRYASWYLLEKPVWLWRYDLVQGVGVLPYEASNDPYERQPVVAASGALMHGLHLPIMLLGAVGVLVGVLRWRRAPGIDGILALVVVGGTLVYLPVIPDPRYLQPVRPLILVSAAATAAQVVHWLSALRRPRPEVARTAT